jgi:hypothetical protein
MHTPHVPKKKKLLKPKVGTWDRLFNSPPNLFMKIEENPKAHFIKMSSQA